MAARSNNRGVQESRQQQEVQNTLLKDEKPQKDSESPNVDILQEDLSVLEDEMQDLSLEEDAVREDMVSVKKSTTTQENKQDLSSQLSPMQGKSHADNRPPWMQTVVRHWGEEKIYTTTKCLDATKTEIVSQRCVCVVGIPGAGKSTAIHHAALSLKNKGFVIYIIKGPDELKQFFDEDIKQVFVLDDILGTYSVKQNKIVLWEEHNNDIKYILGKNTKLLVSIRTQLYKQAIKENDFVFLDKSSCTCIDFCDKMYRLDTTEMIGMLTHYLNVKGVDNVDDLIRKIWDYSEKDIQDMTKTQRQEMTSRYSVGLEFSYCFPLLCKAFSCEDALIHNPDPKEFFRNPFPAITTVFEKMKSNNKSQFCGLVLCSAFEGKLTEDIFSINCERYGDLDESSIKKRNVVMASCGVEGQKYLSEIKSALNDLDGVYITRVSNKYQMAHTVFHDVVTYVFDDLPFVFEYGTSEFIRDRIRLLERKSEDDPYMIIFNDEKNIERLANRLVTDLKFNEKVGAWFIAKNPNINDERLISALRRIFSDEEQSVKTLVDTLFKWCMLNVSENRERNEHSDVTEYKLIELCLQVGVDSNMFIDVIDRYPLHISVMSGSVQLTELLLKYGADKRRVEYNGSFSVLHCVCNFAKYNKLELLKLLIEDEEDQSVVRVTSDKHEVEHVHDNILTYTSNKRRNILHYSVDDIKSTSYLLGLMPQINQAVNKRDSENRRPIWYVVNKQHPDRRKVNLSDKDRDDMIQLYKDSGAIFNDSSDDSSEN